MPSLQDRELITDAFYNACIWPTGRPELDDAWLAIFQILLWYEHGYIHIREANDLHKSRVWQERAKRAEAEIATALHLPPDQLSAHVDRMMSMPRWQGMQRNNPLGNGLRILVGEIFRRWGDNRLVYEEEVPAQNWFPGIQMPGRSEAPKIDVVALKGDTPRTIISCKWSGRHDRMSDITNECQEYKAAAVRRQNMHLQHFVITNEMDGQRSDKILNQPCVDGLVMIHLPLAQQLLGGLTPLMTGARAVRRLLDLSELVQATTTW
jgi:hypothetical protein